MNARGWLLLPAVLLAASALAEAPAGRPAPPSGTPRASSSAQRSSTPLEPSEASDPLPLAPKLQVAAVGLAQAVQLTVANDPRIQAARQEVALASGQEQEASGHFDQMLTAGPSYSRSLSELSASLRDREMGKRLLLTRLGEAFTTASAAVADQLARSDIAPPQCPDGLGFVGANEIDSLDFSERVGLAFEDTVILLPRDLARGQRQYMSFCSPPGTLGPPPGSMLTLARNINAAAGLGLADEALTMGQIPRETINVMADVTREVMVKARLAVERLGTNPVDEVSSSMAFKGGYSKLLHNGMLFRTDFRYQGSERNFVGKSLDPAFGGFGLRNDFPTYLTFSLDMPLGRNRGAVSTAAPERAAEFSLLAERDTLRATVAEEVFSTVLAYVALQSAQQSLAWLEQSAARQQRLVQLSEQLVDGGELPRSELDRVRARAALVASQVAAARGALVRARFTLAQAIGLAVEAPEDAPLAADGLPTNTAPPPPAPVLGERAVANRRELRAAAHLQSAAEVLARAARADLKRRFDLNVTAGVNTLYESHVLRLFPGEQDVQPYDNGVRFASLEGPWRSLQRRWRPSISAQLVFELPVRNSAARGRLAQEESSFQTSRIQSSDLERTVRANVTDISTSVRRAAEAVASHRESLSHYERALEAALARFGAGDMTLIDTLVTEEDLTRQRLQLARAVQEYLSLVARLRYETGEMVTFAEESGPGEQVEFDAAPFLAP